MATILMKHAPPRCAIPDTSRPVATSGHQPATSQTEQPVRRMAYCFDDTPHHPRMQMDTPLHARSAPSPPSSSISHKAPTAKGSAITSTHLHPRGAVRTGISGIADGSNLSEPVLRDARSLSNINVDPSRQDSAPGHLYPDFLRKRLAPDRNMVAQGEVDRGLLMETEKVHAAPNPSRGELGALIK